MSHAAAAMSGCLPQRRPAAAHPALGAGTRAVAAVAPQRHSLAVASRRPLSRCASVVAAAEPAAAAAAPTQQPIPRGPQEIVRQAAEACSRAWAAGVRRQRVELLLPLIGATDLDDWPGGIRQQFKAAQPMVEDLLRQVKVQPGLQGPLSSEILDDGDAVAAWTGKSLAAVLFPTAETLGDVRRIADARQQQGLTLLVNPQWTTQGQLVSDFGIFPWQRKAAEEFLSTFQDAYVLKQLRISGDTVRLIYSYPYGWQVNVSRPENPAQSECVLQQPERPSYKQLEVLLRGLSWSMSSKPIAERIAAEARFIQSSLEPPPGDGQ